MSLKTWVGVTLLAGALTLGPVVSAAHAEETAPAPVDSAAGVKAAPVPPTMSVAPATATNVSASGFDVTLYVTDDPVGITAYGTARSLYVVTGAVTCVSYDIWNGATANYSQDVAVGCTGVPVPGAYSAQVLFGDASGSVLGATFALTIPATTTSTPTEPSQGVVPGANNDSVTPPVITGVTYTCSAWASGVKTCTASADAGYVLPADSTTSWTLTDANTPVPPTTTPSPTPVVDKLPNTGPSVPVWLGGVTVLLLLIGGGMVFVSRRPRKGTIA